jgi:hypothetical protein
MVVDASEARVVWRDRKRKVVGLVKLVKARGEGWGKRVKRWRSAMGERVGSIYMCAQVCVTG